MAIFHCSIKNFNRNAGAGNVCSAAAYRSGERLKSADDNKTKYPHRSKDDIEDSGLLNNPYESRQKLWNEVEKKDNRKNSNLAREVMVAIPKELDREQRKQLINEYSGELVKRYNVAVDYAIHKPNEDNDNFHAHILFTTREIKNNELDRKTRILDEKQTGSKEFEYIRSTWAERANQTLEKYGFEERISAKKSEDEIKCIHHGHNSELKKENESRKNIIKMEADIKKELDLLEKEKQELKQKEIEEKIKIELEKDQKAPVEKLEKEKEQTKPEDQGFSIEFCKTPAEMLFEEEKKQLMEDREKLLDKKYSEITGISRETFRLQNEFEGRNVFYKIFMKKSHERKLEKMEKALEAKREDIKNTVNMYDEKIHKQIMDYSKDKKYIEPGQQIKDFQKLLSEIDKGQEKKSILDKVTEQAQERIKDNPQELSQNLHR